ncbi:MAG: PilN domain-containing protein [Pseudomonadales bacterium]|nr:PilN domain-containing protein [Candidatus Woesebacteria bacterium]MCB9801776.1 PilN domain-containing protein [Pseudomonadales bacterium]
MKKRKPVDVTINLLPRDPFYASTFGRVMRWGLTTGRYLIILTEIIVIGSFATRFTLDRQITDLNASILQKEKRIQAYGTLETDVRVAQKRTTDYSEYKTQANIVEIFPEITAITPDQVTFNTLTINDATVVINGVANSQTIFTTFINNLQLSPKLNNIQVGNVSSPEEGDVGYAFELTAQLTVTKENNNE